jgi:hypothetical protein
MIHTITPYNSFIFNNPVIIYTAIATTAILDRHRLSIIPQDMGICL